MQFNEATLAEAVEAQRAAAHDPREQVRTIAGPGTGKSYTLEERVCWLLEGGVDAKSIAAVSFTRASARDLERRIRRACETKGHDHGAIHVSTLHSLALRALRAHGALTAYPVDPRVLDGWELRNIFDDEFGCSAGVAGITRREEIRADFEAFWSTGSHGVAASQKPPDPPITPAERKRFRAFHTPRTQLYACVLPGEIVQRCVGMMEAGTLDLADLLRIEHLIIDEFQDLNPMDLRFAAALAIQGVTLFVAGDDDQSIYSFRYAHPEGIQKFGDDYPGCGDHVLRHCFRCTPAVLTMAETLISANPAPDRIPKGYVSLYADADPPVNGVAACWRFSDAQAEAKAIASSCRELIAAGMPAREIMVLVSNQRALAKDLYDAFEAAGVPYDPPKDEGYAGTKAGRALYTILRLAGSRNDFVALRALLVLRKGTGIRTADGIAQAVIKGDFSYRELFYDPLDENLFETRAIRALRPTRAIAQELADWSDDDLVVERREDLRGMIARVLNVEPEDDWDDPTEGCPRPPR
jgi:DNA helicase-2/ATP-dependent DNA helicase PcrA